MEVWADRSAISFPWDAGHLDTKSWCWQRCTQECDQDNTTKGKDYKEELAKWEPWLKQLGLTCPRETENLQTCSFVYIVDVTEVICTKDTQHLPFKQRPMMAGEQKKEKLWQE